jgi:hypothetical protein
MAGPRARPLSSARGCGTLVADPNSGEAKLMKRLVLIAIAVALATPALAQGVDIKKAVDCQTLTQQFGDASKLVEMEEAALTKATDLAKKGTRACTSHNYDAGMDQLRQALQQIKQKPIV